MNNIILCGGSGTRLWPLSRTMLPKQFVRLFGGKSLFQKTLERNRGLCSSRVVVSNAEQFFLAFDQLSSVGEEDNSIFLLEPLGRNTAPAVALACMTLKADELVLVTSSDHIIKNQEAYEKAVKRAAELAEQGNLMTFGIKPSYAEIGYGYIEAENENVLSFREKPELNTAEEFIEINNKLAADGKPRRYYWNAGIFCFKAGSFLQELKRYAPNIFNACEKAYENIQEEQGNRLKIGADYMVAIPADSIDYAVMEKSDKVKVVTCDIGWSDLGSFDSLGEQFSSDESKNTVLNSAENLEPICINSSNNLVVTENRQVSLIDINDLIVVDTADALLISRKGSSQKVKALVEQVKKVSKELTERHRLVHRPWGSYEVLLDVGIYKIKRVIVKPESKLSLQKHLHRSEHWVVVSGTATVTLGERKFCVRPNESTYIRIGEAHRLENEGKLDLVLIEVQVGEYTGEDDIIRIDDAYGR